MSSAGLAEASILATLKKLFKTDSVTGVASVELWVLLTTLLLVVRFVLDCFGPWHAERSMAATVRIIEMLNYSMVHYTLGLMQLSAKKVNDYFQVWAVLLVTLQYSVKTGRPYRMSKQIPVLDLMSSFWAANLIRIQTFFLLRIPLWLIWALNAIRIISYFASSDRAATINQENTRLVSDYMRYEHTLGPSGDAADSDNGIRMQSYKYLVSGEDLVLHDAQRERKSASAQYKIWLDPDNKKLVTVEKIWNVDSGSSRLLGGTNDTGNRLKDVCLSLALYKLLRRRFYNLPIHEASHEKTRRLLFDYILQENSNNYERAFRVTEVELSFLQDLFYSKYAAMFAVGFPILSMLMSLSLVGATGYLAFPVSYIPERMDKADNNIITHGVAVTRVIVGLIVAKELSEVYLYVFSNWSKVLMICMYVKHRCLRHPVVEAAMRTVFWPIGGKWNQKISQCNLLISYSRNKQKLTQRIKLESQVKTAIFQSFKGLQKHPERLGSYFLNAFGSKEGLVKQLAWAVELEADTHRILVWHVATCLCEIDISAEVIKRKTVRRQNSRLLAKKSTTKADVWPHYLTASSLSNYCAYLLTIALVPDNGIVVTKVLHAVRCETYHATGRSASQSLRDVNDKLMEIAMKHSEESEEEVANGVGDAMGQVAPESAVIHEEILNVQMANDEEDPNTARRGDATNSFIPATNREGTFAGDDDIHDSIIQMGAKLGKQLIEAYGEDKVGLWRDLAVFWTGFLLNLAASTRAAKHKTRLVTKGELITHLWVLLSHAGFLGNTRHGQTLLDPHDLDEIDPLS
ncbi:uncharacterized protein [Aegilops tauschii subsp. strangulata]|uniref:DUF4220 domain-containing protein n=2 Tax=Aegilops tauschii TaxID=37682 RepID=A0A452ZBN9_AEGTS|nr:uncharacterized protein LOC109739748 [Aegilops tauschii subsp. strangulata]